MTGGPGSDHAPASPGDGPLQIPADTLAVRDLGGWLVALLAATGPQEAAVLHARMELAVHEICMNVVDHAYGPAHTRQPDDITLRGALTSDAVRITVRDNGFPFDEGEVQPPVPGVPQVRGYGLLIAEKLADAVDYRRDDDVNVWTLRFDRTPQQQGE